MHRQIMKHRKEATKFESVRFTFRAFGSGEGSVRLEGCGAFWA